MTARLLILYGHPHDANAFEQYYAKTHIPFAGKTMPHVRNAQNARVLGTANGGSAPYYRVSHLVYDDVDALRAGIASADGQAVLADLDNFATGGATVLVIEDD